MTFTCWVWEKTDGEETGGDKRGAGDEERQVEAASLAKNAAQTPTFSVMVVKPW